MALIIDKRNHLKKGDTLPQFIGKLRLYNMRLCPYAQRTVLALNAKQVDYEVVNVDLIRKPDWLSTKNPAGKLPILEVKDGVTIYESLLTVDYIDEAYHNRPLLPKDPLKKVHEKLFVKAFEPVETLYINLLKFPAQVTKDAIETYHNSLKYVQDQLKTRGTRFLGGSEPGYADFMIWPWLERYQILEDERVKVEPSKYALLIDYIENMFNDPVVKSYLTPKKYLIKLHEEYILGTFDTQCLDE